MTSFLYPVVRSFLESPAGPAVSFAWGFAEALFWPIIPDFFGVAAVPASPRDWWKVAAGLTAGSVAGGIVGYWLAATRRSPALSQLPLVTPAMADQTSGWLTAHGGLGVFRQPLSGVPYKVFVYTAGEMHVSFVTFLWASLIARGIRMFATAGISAALARIAGEGRVAKYYDVFLLLFTVVFAYGLTRVVASKR